MAKIVSSNTGSINPLYPFFLMERDSQIEVNKRQADKEPTCPNLKVVESDWWILASKDSIAWMILPCSDRPGLKEVSIPR